MYTGPVTKESLSPGLLIEYNKVFMNCMDMKTQEVFVMYKTQLGATH